MQQKANTAKDAQTTERILNLPVFQWKKYVPLTIIHFR